MCPSNGFDGVRVSGHRGRLRFEVRLDRGVLRNAGERASGKTADDPKVQVYRRERGPNSFSHTFALPEDIDAEAAVVGIGATSCLVAYA